MNHPINEAMKIDHATYCLPGDHILCPGCGEEVCVSHLSEYQKDRVRSRFPKWCECRDHHGTYKCPTEKTQLKNHDQEDR